MNNLDLFGAHEAPQEANGELFEGRPGLQQQLAAARERYERASRDYERSPTPARRKRLMAATKEFLALRDHRQGMSTEEVRAQLVAEGRAQALPADNHSHLEGC